MQIHPASAVLALTSAAVLGWSAHTNHAVHAAAEPSASAFQIQGSGPNAQLTLYDAPAHRIYIYQGVLGGFNQVSCSYSLHFEKLGGQLVRENCPVGTVR